MAAVGGVYEWDRAGEIDRVEAEMAIEAAVHGRDEGLRKIRRKGFERNRGAAHVAARRHRLAVEAENRDRRRPLWHHERLNRRQLHHVQGDDDADRDRGPDAEYDTPIEEPAERERAPLLAAGLPLLRGWRFGDARRGIRADGLQRAAGAVVWAELEIEQGAGRQ